MSGFWNTMPTLRRISPRAFLLSVRIPSIETIPDEGTRRPFRSLAKVLFPDPLCPITETRDPFSIDRDTPDSTFLSSPSYANETSSNVMRLMPCILPLLKKISQIFLYRNARERSTSSNSCQSERSLSRGSTFSMRILFFSDGMNP